MRDKYCVLQVIMIIIAYIGNRVKLNTWNSLQPSGALKLLTEPSFESENPKSHKMSSETKLNAISV